MILIRGIILTDIQLRVIIGQRFVDIWAEYLKCGKNWLEFWEHSAWRDGDNIMSLSRYLGDRMGLDIWTWPEKTKLYGVRFVLSNTVNIQSILEPLNSVVTLSKNMFGEDEESDRILKRQLVGFGVHEDVKTVILPLSKL